MRALLICLLLLPALRAQDPPAATPKMPPLARGRVTGKVICSDTRQPARGAMVLLQPMPSNRKSEPDERGANSLAARVATDGSYAVEHVAAGEYAVIGFFPGYLSPLDGLTMTDASKRPEEEMRARLSSANLIRVARDTPRTADLVLERGATISGRVLYSDGAPATQSNLELEDVAAKPAAGKPGEMSMDLGAMMRGMFTHQSTGTDDTGHFRIAGLRPGTYRIAVTQPVNLAGASEADGASLAMVMLGGISDPNGLRIYAGDTIHKKSAKTYELRAGETLDGLDIRIPLEGFHPVRVRLTATDGRPLTGASVTLADNADDTLRFHAVNRQDGVFEFPGVPAGIYTLTAASGLIGPQYGPPTAAFADGTAAVIVKDSDPAEVLLTLKETALPRIDPNLAAPEQ